METTRITTSLAGRCLVALYRLRAQGRGTFEQLGAALGEAESEILDALLALDAHELIVLEDLRLTLEGLALAAAASSEVRLSRTGLCSIRAAA